jgi:hypothetical protein
VEHGRQNLGPGGSEQPRQEKQTSRPNNPSAAPGVIPSQPATLMEKGEEPYPGSVREKQKASPGPVPDISLPAYSIPVSPNLLARLALEEAERRVNGLSFYATR